MFNSFIKRVRVLVLFVKQHKEKLLVFDTNLKKALKSEPDFC